MITAMYAGFLGVMLVLLSVRVIKARMRNKVAHGDGNSLDLQKHRNAQANFTEYAPLFLLVLGFAEMQQLNLLVVHVLGALFVFGRMLHAYGLTVIETPRADGGVDGSIKCRQIGMMLTFFTLTVASLAALYLALAAQAIY